ncbi:MAG: hypothetical protein ACJ72H_00535 [Candidatus Sulfotelmatobacter sp.]
MLTIRTIGLSLQLLLLRHPIRRLRVVRGTHGREHERHRFRLQRTGPSGTAIRGLGALQAEPSHIGDVQHIGTSWAHAY